MWVAEADAEADTVRVQEWVWLGLPFRQATGKLRLELSSVSVSPVDVKFGI
jgi:hypothetical protein